MSGGDDWAPGDIAWCVAECGNEAGADASLTVGAIYTVTEVFIGEDENGDDGVALELAEVRPATPGYDGYDATAFRKVTPPEADEFDRETIALLTGKPTHLPA